MNNSTGIDSHYKAFRIRLDLLDNIGEKRVLLNDGVGWGGRGGRSPRQRNMGEITTANHTILLHHVPV